MKPDENNENHEENVAEIQGDKSSEVEQRVNDGTKESGNEASEVVGNALLASNRQLDRQVKETLRARQEEVKNRELPESNEYAFLAIESDFRRMLEEQGYDASNISIAPPASNVKGAEDVDLAFNIGSVAKKAGKKVPELAPEIADLIRQHPMVAEVRTIGPFINVILDFEQLAPAVLKHVGERKDVYGHLNEGEGKTVVIDYSGPNIAKNMTVAHLRSTIIGHSLSKIYEAAGYTGFRINHLGDWGTQFGKIIHQYRKEVEEHGDAFLQRLDDDPATVLLEIYRKFVSAEEDNPEAVQEAQEIFLQLEKGDPELVALWNKFREWSLQEFAKVYGRLNIQFDAMQGESFYEDRMEGVVEEGLGAGVLKQNDEGAVVFPGQPITDPATKKVNEKVMRAQKDKHDPRNKETVWRDEILLKPTGGTVYLTRDLAAIKYRSVELDADKIMYVIGKEQQKHCAMLMNMVSQMGWNEIGDSQHISFGHLNVDGRKMKSRQGKVVLLNDVLDESIDAAKALLSERKAESGDESPLTPEEEETARKIGMGAVIYNDLKQFRESDIEFNFDAARTIETGGCPYVQYTYCRLNSIREKIGEEGSTEAQPEEGYSAEEKGLIMAIAMFPTAVQDAIRSNAPHKIANYVDDLTQKVNSFYHAHHIGRAEGQTQAFRLALIESCQQVLRNATELLHVELPEKM